MDTEKTGEEVIMGDRDFAKLGARPRGSNSLAITFIVIGLTLFVSSLASYWYMSPVLTIRSMRAASEAGDADTFNSYVDYPKLRESLKGHLTASLTNVMAPKGSDSDGAKAGAVLGAALGLALVNNLVDALVRPEVVMRAMKEGRLSRTKATETRPQTPGRDAAPADAATDSRKPEWIAERKGMDKYIVHLRESGKTENMLSLVFERTGFANWKLTELRPNFPS